MCVESGRIRPAIVITYTHNFANSRKMCIIILFRFILELEGSQNVRVLLYEDADRPILRGKAVIEVSRARTV